MRFITNIEKERFNSFVAAHPKGHFLQSYDWGTFKADTKEWTMDTVGIEDHEGNLMATALLLLRKIPVINRPFIYIARGFVLDYNNKDILAFMTEQLANYGKAKRAIFFKIDPDIFYVTRTIDGKLVEEGPDNKAVFQRLTDLGYKHQGFSEDFFSSIQPRFTLRLPLVEKSEKDILSGMRSKTRQIIKNAEKKGVEIYEGSREDLVHLERLTKQTAIRNNFISRPLSYYEHMYDSLIETGLLKLYFAKLNPKKVHNNLTNEIAETEKRIEDLYYRLENGSGGPRQEKKIKGQLEGLEVKVVNLNKQLAEIDKIAETTEDEVVMGGILFLKFGNKYWSIYGGDDVKFRDFAPNFLVHWAGIKDALASGYEIYDFFGISGRVDEEDPLYGLYLFKSGFGGDFTEFLGEFDYVLSPFYYYMWSVMLPRFKKLRQNLRKKK